MTGLPHLALVGPTAAGKSALAIELATALGDVEIVSVDSMQVYRGMDVGTAKPTPAEQARVPHHLVDVADPWQEWSVVRFRDAVRAAVADVEARGRRALLVGGTGLYFRAAVDPLEFPPEDRALRRAVEREVGSRGLEPLYQELREADAVAAGRIEPHNTRRIVRALEVIRLTGRPFSSFGPGLTTYGDPVFPVSVAGVRLPWPVLDRHIEARLAAMRDAGLVDEVRRLGAHPRGLSRTAREAIGYKEILAWLEGVIPAEEQAFARAAYRTRRFGRRQLRWFARDPRVTWFDAGYHARELLPALLESWDRCRATA